MTVMQSIRRQTCSNLLSPGRQRVAINPSARYASQGLASISDPYNEYLEDRSSERRQTNITYFAHDASQGSRSIVKVFSESISYEPWLREFQEKLYAMAELEDGWDSYDAPAPSPNSIAAASEFLNFLPSSERVPIHVGPTVSGGVGFTLVNGAREVAIQFKNHGRVTLTCIDHAIGGSLETKLFESSYDLTTSLLDDLGRFLET